MKKQKDLLEWKSLYEQAIEIRKLAPWGWMSEGDMVGVEHPITKELAFVSVMGAMQEHFAVGIYKGAEAIYSLFDLKENYEEIPFQELFKIPQLQVSFENRKDITPEDYAQIKQLGFQIRGKNAWPMFRTMGNGFLPWYISDPKEIDFLSITLEQFLEVAPRLKKSLSLLPLPETQKYLIRCAKKEKESWVWNDEIRFIAPPEPQQIPIFLDFPMIQKLKDLPQTKQAIELDCFLLPSPVFGEKDERPYFPYVIILVEVHSGMILNFEMLEAQKKIEDRWKGILVSLMQHFDKVKNYPKEIHVRNNFMYPLLKPLTQGLQIKLKQSSTLPALDHAKAFMDSNFRDADF